MHGQLAREFAEMAQKVHEETEFQPAAHRLIDLACAAMRCEHAAVLFVHDGVVETIGVTDPAAEKADQLENELHEGPSLAAVRDRDVYAIEDTLADERSPRWSSGAAALGLRSVLSARLPTTGSDSFALTVYSESPSAFGAEAGAVARMIVQHASGMPRRPGMTKLG